MERLYTLFPPEKIISNPDWPPRSPDLSTLDNFLWSHLKNKVYTNYPKTLDDLKQNIIDEIAKIDKTTLENVFSNFIKRCHLCIQMKGGHFEHLL